MIIFNKKEIEEVFKLAENELLCQQNVSVITYKNFDHKTFDDHNQELLNYIAGKPIVYCIWTGNSAETLTPKYIGHAGSKISRQRLRSHLTKKDVRTGAQLENIITELSLNQVIGISTVTTEPGYMRKALEDWLIDTHSEKLTWNQIGRKKQKVTKPKN